MMADIVALRTMLRILSCFAPFRIVDTVFMKNAMTNMSKLHINALPA
jgi:hypothetical protein